MTMSPSGCHLGVCKALLKINHKPTHCPNTFQECMVLMLCTTFTALWNWPASTSFPTSAGGQCRTCTLRNIPATHALTNYTLSIFLKPITTFSWGGTHHRGSCQEQNMPDIYTVAKVVDALAEVPSMWHARRQSYTISYVSHACLPLKSAKTWPNALIGWLKPARISPVANKEPTYNTWNAMLPCNNICDTSSNTLLASPMTTTNIQ